MNTKLFIIAIISITSLSVNAETIVSGKYESLDGKFKHNFKKSGDYWGQRAYDNAPKSQVNGVYEQGVDICANSKNAYGNIKVYVEQVQCCMAVKKISNKYVVSKVWAEGRGTGYALCNNHVLIKK